MKPKVKNKLRNRKIGSILIDGPEYIIPPSKYSYGWYDQVYCLIDQPMGVNKKAFSYSVYVDNTVNRHKNFLLPLVRYVEWDRDKEYSNNRIRNWPLVNIYQHILNEAESKKINKLLLQIDDSLSKIKFLKAGLIIDRSDPVDCWYVDEEKYEFGSLLVKRWNFCQSIEFGIGGNPKLNPVLIKNNQRLATYIKQLCRRDTCKNYREHYSYNLSDTKDKNDGWFYRPKTSG